MPAQLALSVHYNIVIPT